MRFKKFLKDVLKEDSPGELTDMMLGVMDAKGMLGMSYPCPLCLDGGWCANSGICSRVIRNRAGF